MKKLLFVGLMFAVIFSASTNSVRAAKELCEITEFPNGVYFFDCIGTYNSTFPKDLSALLQKHPEFKVLEINNIGRFAMMFTVVIDPKGNSGKDK